jgi:hypothetical protein
MSLVRWTLVVGKGDLKVEANMWSLHAQRWALHVSNLRGHNAIGTPGVFLANEPS